MEEVRKGPRADGRGGSAKVVGFCTRVRDRAVGENPFSLLRHLRLRRPTSLIDIIDVVRMPRPTQDRRYTKLTLTRNLFAGQIYAQFGCCMLESVHISSILLLVVVSAFMP